MEGNGLVTGLIETNRPRLPLISEVLFPAKRHNFGGFCTLGSNAHAVESTKLFSSNQAVFVALVGPSGWGKTHLLSAASARLKTIYLNSAEVLEASEWAMSPGRREFCAPLILDNVQDALERSRVRLQLMLALERRVRAGSPTLLSFTSNRCHRALKGVLPHSKDWIICDIQPPCIEERKHLVSHMAEEEGLKLSAPLIKLLSSKLQGNGRTFLGALKRLRLHQSQWLDPSMTIRACGVLNPFFADNSSWDLREHIAQCAEHYCAAVPLESGELSIFTMLRVALLAEADVAHYLEIEPAAAYTRAIRFEERISCPNHCRERDHVLGFLRYVIERLNADVQERNTGIS